jgi:quercetin dioxygenase-like cupin family protein
MMPAIVHHFSDGLYAKETFIPANTELVQHKHNYAHFSILAQGSVVVTNNDGMKIVHAPACIEIKAGEHHSVEAITNVVWFCIHATDEKDSSKVDEVLIKGV